MTIEIHSLLHYSFESSRLLMPNMIYIAASDFTGNVTTAQVDSIFVHPSYDERKMDNDIALLKVRRRKNYISFACCSLAVPNQHLRYSSLQNFH